MSNGIFIKTVSPHIVEVLGGSGLDFAVIDAEHAPFDHRDIDLMLLAGRAAGLPLFVRVRNTGASEVQAALDMGAAGVVVPRVDSVDIARQVVSSARFIGGRRGFSGGTRLAGYGKLTMSAAIDAGDVAKVIVQIEHPDALRDAAAILALDGVDGILIGRADLALSMGFTAQCREVEEAVAAMLGDLDPAGKIVGVVVGSGSERDTYRALGANWFLVGTDHSLLRRGVNELLDRVAA
jgi:2-keto-3-deoxy-L-rhamnonate aldolase RhmA